ncbi:SRPBCC family protein [Granulosicoccus sp. 3-233]|uniref:SRPBCC family protein n=1 Tax=Granulosicoccus sp. 3-233 TaxID=3417969 RepID=UPI003D32761F
MFTPIVRILVAVSLLAASGLLSAHGPTRQKVVETIEIDAPASEVWAVVGKFGGADVWLPMVQSSTSQGGHEEGASRTLVLGPDASVHETLKKHSDEKMSYTYRIPVKTHDVALLPVNNYSSTISVKATDSGSLVTWKGAFYRGYPNNDPPAELNDEAAVAAVTALTRLDWAI